MARYIDAELIKYGTYEYAPYQKIDIATKDSIDRIPTADVAEVKHGHWVDDNNGRTYINGERVRTKLCNHCGCANLFNIVGDPIYSNSCPNCGAEMDGVTI